MRHKQMSLRDIYFNINDTFESDKARFFDLLNEHINWNELIPDEFFFAYNADTGRPRDFTLVSMVCFFVVKDIFGFTHDNQFLNVLKYCTEIRRYIGFTERIPDAAQISRFRAKFGDFIQLLHDRLVDVTEPICQAIDPKLAATLINDTTGVESYVTENNPKFFNSKLRQAKAMCKGKADVNPYTAVYGLLPEASVKNPAVKQQYINGHFCYAQKFAVLTNGLGIVRGVYQLGEKFKEAHPEMTVAKRTDNPDADKEISDSHALAPVLRDHFKAHPNAHYDTFLGDSAFDSYDTYSSLMNDFHFKKVLIPLNPRNSAAKHEGSNEDGIPLCPKSGEPLRHIGKSGGKNRSDRIKFICPKSVHKGHTWVCQCDDPCTTSAYGRCAYVYPNSNQRLYPGIIRDSDEWSALYKNRTAIERTIGYLKNDLSVNGRRTSHPDTTRADFLFAAIAQLIGVIIADKIHKRQFAKRVRHLLNAA